MRQLDGRLLAVNPLPKSRLSAAGAKDAENWRNATRAKVVYRKSFNYRTRAAGLATVVDVLGLKLTKSDFADRAEAAEHIALEASRLARIANTNEFPLLSYLIDMVVLEAWREASEPDAPPPDLPAVTAGGL